MTTRRCRFPLVAFILAILNTGSTVLMLLSGLSENPILVSITGRYAPMRARLMDGSINLEIAQDDVIRLEHLTPLKDIGEKFRFITAPRRNPYSYGTNRSLCMVVNSINSTTLGAYFDDFWGKGSRRYQLIVYSISAPKCKVLNLKPKWRSQCIKEKGNTTACNQYILNNFETLQQNRLIQSGTVSDFGTYGQPFLKCLGRPFKSFEYQTDMVTHMAYWAGGDQHVQIQTSDCLAKPLIRNPDWQWGLFEVESVDQDSDIVLGLPEPGWITWTISGLYSIVTLVLIARGLIAFLLQNRIARYIPDEVRYSKEYRLARYVAPFMPIAMLLTEDDRSIIPFKGSLLIASDLWMNNWLYITLSILDSVSNIRMTYAALHLGTIYIVTRITPQNFLFVCQALTRMTWLTCLIHTVLRVVAKVSIRSLRSMQLIQRTTRDKLVRYVDGVAMFISFKVYNIFLCIILFCMMKTLNSTSFQIRQNPHKVGNYGGIPKIATFWRSELMCDLITILLMLTACGHVLGTFLMITRFRSIADNGVMKLLQKRYFWVGWDALMAAKMLGLDPTRSTWMVDGKAVTRCPLGTLIQTLYQSGPSGFVHLAGDYIFTGSGFTAEPRKFHFPAKRAVAMGLCSGSKGSFYRKEGVTEPESALTLHRVPTHSTALVSPVDRTAVMESFLQKEKASIFDRNLRLVADGYMGKILLVDKAEPGAMTTNKDTGLREYVVCDALSTISILDIKGILGNEKKLRIE